MDEYAEYYDENDFEVSEPGESYTANWDFTSLEAWKRAREVKLFFYMKTLPKLPPQEKYNKEKHMTDFKNKNVLLTGAANGIGRLLAQEIVAGGGKLFLWDIDRDGLDSLKAELQY